jgi:hypothetical protein
MQNHQLNQSIDFQNELYQLLSQESTDDDLCLISNLPLDDNPIELSCGHKFNYHSIYNEIKYQKTHSHHLETQKLLHSEIKCPYCRTIQKGLLPCRNNYENIKGVNWPKKYQYKANICEYIFLSGKRKNIACGKKCFDKYCDGHFKIIKSRENKKEKKQTGTPSCQYVYKRGKNKGNQCKCQKPYHPDKNGISLFDFPWQCKSHYKQSQSKVKKINNKVNSENIVIKV